MSRVSNDVPEQKLVMSKVVSPRDVSVGAGARIRQELQPDGLGIDGWKDEPSSIIRLYFCFSEQFRAIVDKGGIKGIQTNDSGFLDGLPVG